MAAFHAQQAAEKLLKAWLLALGEEEPPLTHSLTRLAEALSRLGATDLPNSALRFLSRFPVGVRYGVVEVSAADAARAVEEAERVVELCKRALSML